MNSFKRRAGLRIAAVSLLLTAIASPIAWFIAHEAAERSTVALAMEDSRRLLHHANATALTGADAVTQARAAAETVARGLFDIVEIYDRLGIKLAKAMTQEGRAVEAALPGHGRPGYTEASHESFELPGQGWVLRVFVPLRGGAAQGREDITGYFEGVRVIPDWQHAQMLANALSAAAMVALASLLCGAAIYPVVVRLAADNERKAHELPDSHISMMEALGRHRQAGFRNWRPQLPRCLDRRPHRRTHGPARRCTP